MKKKISHWLDIEGENVEEIWVREHPKAEVRLSSRGEVYDELTDYLISKGFILKETIKTPTTFKEPVWVEVPTP